MALERCVLRKQSPSEHLVEQILQRDALRPMDRAFAASGRANGIVTFRNSNLKAQFSERSFRKWDSLECVHLSVALKDQSPTAHLPIRRCYLPAWHFLALNKVKLESERLDGLCTLNKWLTEFPMAAKTLEFVKEYYRKRKEEGYRAILIS